MAAGLTLEQSQLAEFEQAFQRQVAQCLSADDLQVKLVTDGSLSAQQLAMPTAQLLRDAGPWGQQFPEPSFSGNFLIAQQRIVGENHLKLSLAPQDQPDQVIDAIWFNIDTAEWPNPALTDVNCVFRLDINEFRGMEKVQLLIQHMQPLLN